VAAASITVILIPDQDTASPPHDPAQFATAQLLHIRVFVRWMESSRRREVVLDTVKAF